MISRMQIALLFLSVGPLLSASITVSPNGNSPSIKMRAMAVEMENGFTPILAKPNEVQTLSNYDKSRKLNVNNSQLSINERYRRLIPYMTFYYANDLISPTTSAYEMTTKDNVEIQKANVEEEQLSPREAKRLMTSPFRNVPRYQGNRLTKHNIASANPKGFSPSYQIQTKPTQNYNVLYPEQGFVPVYRNPTKQVLLPKQNLGLQSQRKPYFKSFQPEQPSQVQYHNRVKETPAYKFVPYEQTPVQYYVAPNDGSHQGYNGEQPKKIYVSQPQPKFQLQPSYQTQQDTFQPQLANQQLYQQTPTVQKEQPVAQYRVKTIHVPVYSQTSEVYIKPQSLQHYKVETSTAKEQYNKPTTVSEVFYQRDPTVRYDQPTIESGFRPIVPSATPTVAPESYIQSTQATPIEQSVAVAHHYNTMLLTPKPEVYYTQPQRYEYVSAVTDSPIRYRDPVAEQDSQTLREILSTLQQSKAIPKPITRDNIGASIKTLLNVLSTLKGTGPQHNEIEPPVLSSPKPFIHPVAYKKRPVKLVRIIQKPITTATSTQRPVSLTPELSDEDYLPAVTTPSQYLEEEEYKPGATKSQSFPLAIHSEDDGGTPGRAGVDYPTLTTIPHTSFDCKTQRYKGFFADPETRCQVWHYCDLNGGQASFLCPNGTIFSQAGLTCDWWFNVRCASATQLYVLNESLYKYILPHSPKFPEDYSGPLVDKYLTLKFKEMEEQFRKKKKQNSKESTDDVSYDEGNETETKLSDLEEPSETEQSTEVEASTDPQGPSDGGGDSSQHTLGDSGVVVETPGNSGNVQRLVK